MTHEKSLNFCLDINKANAAILEADKWQEKLGKAIIPFYQEEKDWDPIFFKDVDYQIRAKSGDSNFEDLKLKRLEIRPSLDTGGSKYFCFSLNLVLVTEVREFYFRLARTDGPNVFYLVECKDNGVFTIESGNNNCARFFEKADFIETLKFCYDSIDAFNEKLEVKLKEHMSYLCSFPIERTKKQLPVPFLSAGMKIEIADTGGKLSNAIITSVSDILIDSYPGNKSIRVSNYNGYFPKKAYTFVFIPASSGLREGWYPTTEEYNYNPEGPVYKIKPI